MSNNINPGNPPGGHPPRSPGPTGGRGLPANEIRRRFLDFFQQRDHQHLPSAPLIRRSAESTQFVVAGMVPFVDIIRGVEDAPYSRVTTAQKCIRMGGKHNDWDQIGVTPRHHTFFEMLGNFSFGDYFKPEAIRYAWDFLTDVLELDPSRLRVTVHESDRESRRLWQDLGMHEIIEQGDNENRWALGNLGPVGLCTEVFYDLKTGSGNSRYLEIWNLVFMREEMVAGNKLIPLKRHAVDTGMGLERIAAVSQGVNSNYDTDLFQPLIASVAQNAHQSYQGSDSRQDVAMRIMADHARAVAFLTAEGMRPESKLSGHDLRRLVKRAVFNGRILGVSSGDFFKLVKMVGELWGSAYPELQTQSALIEEIVRPEEIRSIKSLNQAEKQFERELKQLRERKIYQVIVARLLIEYELTLEEIEDFIGSRGCTRQRGNLSNRKVKMKESKKNSGQVQLKSREAGLAWLKAEIDFIDQNTISGGNIQRLVNWGVALELIQNRAAQEDVKLDLDGYESIRREELERSRRSMGH